MKHSNGFTLVGCVGLVVAFAASAANGTPAPGEVPFECNVNSNNDGCEAAVACPSGTKVSSAQVACNLEYGLISEERLASVEPGYVEVVKPSDQVEHGRCWLAKTSVGSGRAELVDLVGQKAISFGCQEYDRNGGDCHIRGVLSCE